MLLFAGALLNEPRHNEPRHLKDKKRVHALPKQSFKEKKKTLILEQSAE